MLASSNNKTPGLSHLFDLNNEATVLCMLPRNSVYACRSLVRSKGLKTESINSVWAITASTNVQMSPPHFSHPRTHVSRVSLYRITIFVVIFYLLLAVDHRTGTLVANPLLPSIRQIKTTLGCGGERRSSLFHPLPPVAALLAESAPPYHSCFILIW